MFLVISLFALSIVYILHISYRNEKTCMYMIWLAARIRRKALFCLQNEIPIPYTYDDMPSYYYVLFSMKLIRDESFLTEDFIQWLSDYSIPDTAQVQG